MKMFLFGRFVAVDSECVILIYLSQGLSLTMKNLVSLLGALLSPDLKYVR
jgi:hypothetical protein